jgi:hypothetical protein
MKEGRDEGNKRRKQRKETKEGREVVRHLLRHCHDPGPFFFCIHEIGQRSNAQDGHRVRGVPLDVFDNEVRGRERRHGIVFRVRHLRQVLAGPWSNGREGKRWKCTSDDGANVKGGS